MKNNQEEMCARANELAAKVEEYSADPISYGSSTTTSSSTVQTEGGIATFSMELIPEHPLVKDVTQFADWLPPEEVCVDEAGGKYFRHDTENCWYRLVNNSRHIATVGNSYFTTYANKFAQWLRSHFGGNPIAHPTESPDSELAIVPSSDFRSAYWNGEEFVFTPLQAACFKLMFEAWVKGTPSLAELTILDGAGSNGSRLKHVFDKGMHPAITANLIMKAGKDLWRLVPDSPGKSPETAKPQKPPR